WHRYSPEQVARMHAILRYLYEWVQANAVNTELLAACKELLPFAAKAVEQLWFRSAHTWPAPLDVPCWGVLCLVCLWPGMPIFVPTFMSWRIVSATAGPVK